METSTLTYHKSLNVCQILLSATTPSSYNPQQFTWETTFHFYWNTSGIFQFTLSYNFHYFWLNYYRIYDSNQRQPLQYFHQMNVINVMVSIDSNLICILHWPLAFHTENQKLRSFLKYNWIGQAIILLNIVNKEY